MDNTKKDIIEKTIKDRISSITLDRAFLRLYRNTQKNPIIYNEFDITNTTYLISMEQTHKVTLDAYNKFKELNLSINEVDHDPFTWSFIFITCVESAKKESKTIAQIPNGCCTDNNCILKLFYEKLDYEFKNLTVDVISS